ncbi:unnamed protein product [Zymoseptoria tritici ST99CH_1A5]|uniref:Uncharacterized protein n=1 Tax=Zymoseptoria tritici ST99CH_1A5 TaxID=1276529 RepID=A0A1Y6LA58_ZYMTR|nr:unnamed protein product [Zymoseptoria tritici ST99CH_3D1]SMY21377.1 unnamed protein product [Zymoseptoria tritici ST99CH_1A5]
MFVALSFLIDPVVSMNRPENRLDSPMMDGDGLHLDIVNKAIADPRNPNDLLPVYYAYDWLKDHSAPYLNIPILHWNGSEETPSLPLTPPNSDDGKDTLWNPDENAFDIHPRAAGIPWHTTLPKCRQNRHWRIGLGMSSKILELYAHDPQISGAVRSNGVSLAKVAAHELKAKEEDRFTKMGIYLFSEADEKRMELLIATIAHIVVFDDSWEMHSGEQLCMVRDDFIARLKGTPNELATPKSAKRTSFHAVLDWNFLNRRKSVSAKRASLQLATVKQTPLQDNIDWMVQGLKACDANGDTGGQEVVDRFIDFCNHVPPQKDFESLGEYLAYRYIDIGFPYMLACMKFSLASSIRIDAPHLTAIYRLFSDHISLVNDLASFEKEKRALDEGKIVNLTNAVALMKRLLSLPSYDDAKRLTFAMQLQVETEMYAELNRLVDGGLVTAEEKRFLEACVMMCAGNTFYSAVGRRYGGEKARIPV